MRRRATSRALLLSFAMTAGCSTFHGDPDSPKKNPHPTKRYELTAMAEAPGPWDSVIGSVSFEVANPGCTPENEFLGVHLLPRAFAIDFEMTRVGGNSWKGYFFRDALIDENYYGLGICRWDITNVSAEFITQGVDFPKSAFLKALLNEGPQSTYFKKTAYGDSTLVRYGPRDYSPTSLDVTQHPDGFFSVTVAVKELTP